MTPLKGSAKTSTMADAMSVLLVKRSKLCSLFPGFKRSPSFGQLGQWNCGMNALLPVQARTPSSAMLPCSQESRLALEEPDGDILV